MCNSITRAKCRLWLSIGLLWLGCAIAVPSVAAGKYGSFVIDQAKLGLVNGVYELDATISYQLSRTQIEALMNGVPLTIEVEFQIQKDYWNMVDWAVIELDQTYRISYHALSQQYVIRNLNTGIESSYPDLATALTELGHVTHLPLFKLNAIDLGDDDYVAGIRASLDIESLPLPLRPIAYLTARWRTASEWYTWPFPR